MKIKRMKGNLLDQLKLTLTLRKNILSLNWGMASSYHPPSLLTSSFLHLPLVEISKAGTQQELCGQGEHSSILSISPHDLHTAHEEEAGAEGGPGLGGLLRRGHMADSTFHQCCSPHQNEAQLSLLDGLLLGDREGVGGGRRGGPGHYSER